MTSQASENTGGGGRSVGEPTAGRPVRRTRRPTTIIVGVGAIIAALTLCWAVWLGVKANAVSSDLRAVSRLAEDFKRDITSQNLQDANQTVLEMRQHTTSAREAAGDPLWTLAAVVPWIGPNFSAVTEVARAADDVVVRALEPLTDVYGSLKWSSLLPSSSGSDLAPLRAAAPSVSSAAYAIRASSDRLAAIDTDRLLPQVAEPLATTTDQLRQVSGVLNIAADVSNVAPAMLGATEPRSYLLMIQNNAEARASGGIPGALAVLTVENGKLSLGEQSSAGDIGVMSPPVTVDLEQQQIYSGRMGKFMQDVNLTPDYPTAASSAQAMWDRKSGKRVDGVISIDPVALSYILSTTGPVRITVPELASDSATKLPLELSSQNVVQTLLSDVYSEIDQPQLQDAYFAAVAQQIFERISQGRRDDKEFIKAITKATEEGRILVWSGHTNEQSVILKYALSGAISGPSVPAAQFGVYMNDGTGAKMDYYIKRTVQLVKECPQDGYEQVTVRVTSTNTAPTNAATTLPEYVTGAGIFGVPPGTVQTNIAVYGPVQSLVETAKLDGKRTEFAPYMHGNRPLGVLAIRLAPGQSKTLEFSFGKIVQHTEPTLVVTPSVQAVTDVTLPTESAGCG